MVDVIFWVVVGNGVYFLDDGGWWFVYFGWWLVVVSIFGWWWVKARFIIAHSKVLMLTLNILQNNFFDTSFHSVKN